MLVVGDGRQLFRTVILYGRLARQVGDAENPAEPGFGSILPGRNQPVGTVEGAGHDLDPGTVDAAEAQGRAAIPAEVTLGDRRGFERSRLAAGPAKVRMLDIGKGSERRARGFLAHPAMTDRDLGRSAGHCKADRAALAAS